MNLFTQMKSPYYWCNYYRADTDRLGSGGRTSLALEEFHYSDDQDRYDLFHALFAYAEADYHTHITISITDRGPDYKYCYVTFTSSLAEAQEFLKDPTTDRIYSLTTAKSCPKVKREKK